MIELESWLKAYADRMEAAFGERLVLLGLQGSYRRGEATEESDIDLVAVLNRVDVEELRRYRALVRELPEGEKACGFIAGQEELRNWPRWDLYQLAGDVRVLRGRAEAVFPAFTAADARQAAREGAAALYHAACHSFLYGEAAARWRSCTKGRFSCCGRRTMPARDTGRFPAGICCPGWRGTTGKSWPPASGERPFSGRIGRRWTRDIGRLSAGAGKSSESAAGPLHPCKKRRILAGRTTWIFRFLMPEEDVS